MICIQHSSYPHGRRRLQEKTPAGKDVAGKDACVSELIPFNICYILCFVIQDFLTLPVKFYLA